ncbi:MAG: ATP synthase F1 subunit delta [Phycisphaerales bacterium JB061]|jgi:F-type H+-transporting ATPase subunit delta
MPLTDARPDALATIYAKSLYELADEQGGQTAVENTLGELEDILEIARGDAQFSEFLSSRVLKQADRTKSLDAMFTGKVSELTLRFLKVLNEKHRLSHLIPIVEALDEMVQQKLGRVEVDLYTAQPVDSGEIAKIKSQLNAALGKEAVVHPYTDPSMIGGVRLQIGDKLIDASLQTRLRKMRDQLADQGGSSLRAAAERTFEDTPSDEG